ncbi:MAP9 protein, partial [Tricholaema leucomelas]|nr:MAP9 protein [Tricholaema leucomelas]
EELNKNSSGAENPKKSVVIESPLSDDDSSQKADLEKVANDDLTFSFPEEKVQQMMLSESENLEDDREDDEECLESQNESDDRKINDGCSAAEVPCDNGESDHCFDLPTHELQEKSNQEEHKPIPKPRVHKPRNASASGEKEGIWMLSWCLYEPLLSCSSSYKCCDRYVPSSVCMKARFLFADKSLNAVSINREIMLNGRNEFVCCLGFKLEDNSRKSPSATEVVTSTEHEITKKLEMLIDENSCETLKIVEGQIVTDTMQEVSANDQPEHGEAKNTSEDSVKVLCICFFLPLFITMSLSSAPLKKKAKPVPSATPVSSQYLGTLKVLEDRCVQNSTELNKADSLRAAVFQNWLEKKRAHLLQLKRIEKKKAENLRNNTEKKEAVKREEASASFEAWKKQKGREAKKLSKQKKLEELKRKKAAEQNEEKTEAAQKAFEKWKERKVEYLREQSRKEKQSERIRKKKEEELIAEKRKDSMSAVEKWNEKKENYTKQKKAEKVLERRKQKIQQAKKEEKDKKAMEEYEKWL